MPRTLLVLLTILAALTGPVASASASAVALLKDCEGDGVISGSYSQKDYAQALGSLPTDTDEYSDCRDLIRQAQLANAGGPGSGGSGSGSPGTGSGTGSGGSGGTSGSGGSATPGTPVTSAAQVVASATPAERAQLAEATKSGAPVGIGGHVISPASSGLSPAGAANILPVPLAVALALLALGAVAAAVHQLRSRVRARRVPGT